MKKEIINRLKVMQMKKTVLKTVILMKKKIVLKTVIFMKKIVIMTQSNRAIALTVLTMNQNKIYII